MKLCIYIAMYSIILYTYIHIYTYVHMYIFTIKFILHKCMYVLYYIIIMKHVCGTFLALNPFSSIHAYMYMYTCHVCEDLQLYHM